MDKEDALFSAPSVCKEAGECRENGKVESRVPRNIGRLGGIRIVVLAKKLGKPLVHTLKNGGHVFRQVLAEFRDFLARSAIER
jgi:hypothetical protein